jgi:hypothetical protein
MNGNLELKKVAGMECFKEEVNLKEVVVEEETKKGAKVLAYEEFMKHDYIDMGEKLRTFKRGTKIGDINYVHVGQRVGQLVAKRMLAAEEPRSIKVVIAQCDCGAMTCHSPSAFLNSRSCGCLSAKIASQRKEMKARYKASLLNVRKAFDEEGPVKLKSVAEIEGRLSKPQINISLPDDVAQAMQVAILKLAEFTSGQDLAIQISELQADLELLRHRIKMLEDAMEA